MLPEGLDQQPVSHIARHISLMGFNCVRLTWATYMFTRHSNLTVAESFTDNSLHHAMSGIAKKNPQLLGLTVVEAQRAVIEELGRHGVMSVLDNHVGKPMWCCGSDDGNGFGRQAANPKNGYWHKSTHELRGPLQNQSVWYENVEKAELDLDWAVWALQGSYYTREGVPDPKSKRPTYHLLFHPQSGKCLSSAANNNVVYASDCIGASRWSHDGDGMPIRLTGTSLCLTASRDGLPVTLSTDCNEQSRVKFASNYQLSNIDHENGKELCLDFDTYYSSSRVLVRKCVGLDGKNIDNPQTQWFKFVSVQCLGDNAR
ncbi:hypothetical protein HAX54_000650 [Datura stramonium]|uniref:Ricin B lectin domain-containing protein n=1 Tax=Datura stramonium TaxID=4076 RepID=A0ABS8RUA0_DATST|nr:hypothetical protein [Datura stramonium]